MPDYRIIDADGHVMELDSELREFIGPPYKDLEWHQSYSFWPGLTMDGFLRSLRKPGGWAGGGTGPHAKDWLNFLDINKIELDRSLSHSRPDPWRNSGQRLGDLYGAALTTTGSITSS